MCGQNDTPPYDACPDCGRDMTAGETHTANCPLAIAQDHADGDHSGCYHEEYDGLDIEDNSDLDEEDYS